MTPFEWIAIVYFALVAAAAGPGRPRALLYACSSIALVIVSRLALSWEARAWMPHAYLVLGYWIPAASAPSPNNRLERWLERVDARFGFEGRGSPALGAGILELAYLLCYPLVPAAFTFVFAHGSREDITRFWSAVLVAGYACYGTLRWTAARPPRLVSPQPVLPQGVAWLNAEVLGRVSHRLVTFPSGHVAVSIAAALSVGRLSAGAGAGFVVVAAMIAVAAVTGRYHYVVDVVLGLLLGGIAFAITGFA